MKKILTIILITTAFCSQAQVVNPYFEVVKPNFLPSNWGMNHFQQVVIDPVTGENTSDAIQYTWNIPYMCYATTDSYSGQYAMEISNAFNQTQNQVITGEAILFSDETQDIPGWNPGVSIATGTVVQTLGFHYKFFPAGNDIAQAYINVFDAEGNEIGTASVDISGVHNQFQYVYAYIDYTSNATPAYMYIGFKMAKEGTNPTFGSRLIIDNVITNFGSLAIDSNEINTDFSVFPTLVDSEISILPANNAVGLVNYKIINTQGRLVKQTNQDTTSNYVYSMNVSDLASGIYFLEIEYNSQKIIKKFVKK